MASQIYPALGNGLNRFFTTTGGGSHPEPRVYQCIKKEGVKICFRHEKDLLLNPGAELVVIPKYVPEVLDSVYIKVVH